MTGVSPGMWERGCDGLMPYNESFQRAIWANWNLGKNRIILSIDGLRSMDFSTRLILLIHDHGVSFHLCLLQVLSSKSYSFPCTDLPLPW